jgi:hypothetical protein
MFSRSTFSDMRRAGMDVGLSKGKLSKAMLEILLRIPMGSANLKSIVVRSLGLIGQMTSLRDINLAWDQTKKDAAKLHPEKFILDGRKSLLWNDGTVKIQDKEISPANFKKLNDLANSEGCNVNAIVSKLIKAYNKK